MDAFSLVNFKPPIILSEIGREVKPFKKGAPPVDVEKRREASDEIKKVLNTILPPREFEECGQIWIQRVSQLAANR